MLTARAVIRIVRSMAGREKGRWLREGFEQRQNGHLSVNRGVSLIQSDRPIDRRIGSHDNMMVPVCTNILNEFTSTSFSVIHQFMSM